MSDSLVRATAMDGQILAFACDVTKLTAEACIRHQTTELATVALGRTLAATAMLSLNQKSDTETLTLQIEGNGPLGKVCGFCDRKEGGHLFGYVEHPDVNLPHTKDGRVDVAEGIGIGLLTITRDLGMKEPYVGTSHLVTSEIAEDLAYYFTVSEQNPSAVSLGVLLNPEGGLWTAGGYILQLLPGASDEVADILQERVSRFMPASHYLARGHTPTELLKELLDGLEPEILAQEEPKFRCLCSREKAEGALLAAGTEAVRQMIASEEAQEIVCPYCNEKYIFNTDEIISLLMKGVKTNEEDK